MDRALLFGRGNYCSLKYTHIKQRYEVVGFLDNAVEESLYDETYGCQVFNPRYVNQFQDCYVICMSAAFVQMWRQLRQLGVPGQSIIFSNGIPPFYLSDEEYFQQGEQLISQDDCMVYQLADGSQYRFKELEEFYAIVREQCRFRRPEIDAIAGFGVKPVSRYFGAGRGMAVDRYYIERFLDSNKEDIRGTVMEVGSNDYIRMFGRGKVRKEIILHVRGGKNAIKGNFETGAGICEHMADCLICTQTLQYIYDVPAAMKSIYKLLKPGGTALITVPGIKSLSIYDAANWGEKWSFTPESMARLCAGVCGEDQFSVQAYGNVKIAIAYLYGLCREDLEEEDFHYNDEQFPFIVAARVKKAG